ncbi:MAG: hypothetical protein V1678_05565 [Candidatus Aenigmatarchaeota archaeon]
MRGILLALVVAATVGGYIYLDITYPNQLSQNFNQNSQTYQVPSQYTGQQGIQYLRQNYGSQFEQARSLCGSQFNGEWVDSPTGIGCINMKGFSEVLCSVDTIRSLMETCRSIGGSPVCNSNQASCSL